VDGAQHLGDAEAYRRDQRKDPLLQQHGYFVPRFLAEGIGKYLDDVLDDATRSSKWSARNNRESDRD
jgi:very-short-patch-repair endonuclease